MLTATASTALRALRLSRLRAVFASPSSSSSPSWTSSHARLLSTLAVLEHRDGKVLSGSLPCLTAAAELGGSVTAFVAGTDSASIAEQAARLQGVSKVLHVPNAAYDRVCSLPAIRSLPRPPG